MARKPESGAKSLRRFDWTPVRNSYRDGEFSKCRDLLQSAPEPHASIWRSRIDGRQGKYAESIARLHALECSDAQTLAERDVWLGVAYANVGDFSMARMLLDRAMQVLEPPAEAYYRGLYSYALTHHLAGESDAAAEYAERLLESPDRNDRGQAHAMRSWLAAKRGDAHGKLRFMLDALDEYLDAEEPDQYGLAHTTQTLAVLCRELPIDEATVERVRRAAERIRPTEATAFPLFQTLRVLGWVDALRGDEVAAMRRWREAERAAPTDFWRVFCIVDRAYLAHAMGRKDAASDLLADADKRAHRLNWAKTREEERLILLTIAQLFAKTHPALAERYLAMYRSVSTPMHLRLNWQGDRRLRALHLYSHAVALQHLGDPDAANMLKEAWSIFTELDYRWRAALTAIDLYKATGKAEWRERAREQAAPWPKSWIAREVLEAR